MAEPELLWTQLERLLPDDRRQAIELVFSKIRLGRAGNRPEIVAILSDPESSWVLGNAACRLIELVHSKKDSTRESPAKDGADLRRRLTARRDGLVEDIARARQMGMAQAGTMFRVPVVLGSSGHRLQDAAERLVAALEAVDDALLCLEAAGKVPQDEGQRDLPEVRFAETFALLVASSGGELSGDKSRGQFRDLLRAALEACDVAVPEHRLKAAAASGIEFVTMCEEGDY